MSVTLHTNLGDLKIEIFCDIVPRSAKNFLALCASGAYTNTIFHRNVQGFVIQGGSEDGEQGDSIYGGFFDDEISAKFKHDQRGIVSWANSGPNTNGRQFFITYTKLSHLDNTSTIFGRVIYGLDTLTKMEKSPVNEEFIPETPIIIKNITIHANPIAEIEINDDTDIKTSDIENIETNK